MNDQLILKHNNKTITLPYKIKINSIKTYFFAFISLIFVAIAAFIYLDTKDLKLLFAGLFFLLCLLIFCIQLLPNASYLILKEDGFKVRQLYRYREIKWSDISEIGLYKLRNVTCLGWNYVPSYKPTKTIWSVNKGLTGYQDALAMNFSIKPKELLTIMAQIYSRQVIAQVGQDKKNTP